MSLRLSVCACVCVWHSLCREQSQFTHSDSLCLRQSQSRRICVPVGNLCPVDVYLCKQDKGEGEGTVFRGPFDRERLLTLFRGVSIRDVETTPFPFATLNLIKH